jgi:hypothetical protein
VLETTNSEAAPDYITKPQQKLVKLTVGCTGKELAQSSGHNAAHLKRFT